MQILTLVKAVSLALPLGIGLSMASAVAPRAPTESELVRRQFVPILPGIEGVLEYASQTLAAQIVGAVTSIGQLKFLCHHADQLDSRLQQEGYDVAYIKNAVCTAANQTALASNAEIQSEVRLASSKIWVVQALGSTLGSQNALCNIFDVDAANAVGLVGQFVKNEICGAGG